MSRTQTVGRGAGRFVGRLASLNRTGGRTDGQTDGRARGGQAEGRPAVAAEVRSFSRLPRTHNDEHAHGHAYAAGAYAVGPKVSHLSSAAAARTWRGVGDLATRRPAVTELSHTHTRARPEQTDGLAARRGRPARRPTPRHPRGQPRDAPRPAPEQNRAQIGAGHDTGVGGERMSSGNAGKILVFSEPNAWLIVNQTTHSQFCIRTFMVCLLTL